MHSEYEMAVEEFGAAIDTDGDALGQMCSTGMWRMGFVRTPVHPAEQALPDSPS